MARRADSTLKLANIGQIRRAELDLGDLTVLVGPQATGKSVALQALKLAVDHSYIINRLRDFGFAPADARELLTLVFGEGMASIWRRGASIDATIGIRRGSAEEKRLIAHRIRAPRRRLTREDLADL